MVDIVRASAGCQVVRCWIPITAVGVAMGNSALKPIKRRGNEGKLNLGGSFRICAVNYVTRSNMRYQNSGKLCVPASSTVSVPGVCFPHKVCITSYTCLAVYYPASIFIQERKKPGKIIAEAFPFDVYVHCCAFCISAPMQLHWIEKVMWFSCVVTGWFVRLLKLPPILLYTWLVAQRTLVLFWAVFLLKGALSRFVVSVWLSDRCQLFKGAKDSFSQGSREALFGTHLVEPGSGFCEAGASSRLFNEAKEHHRRCKM